MWPERACTPSGNGGSCAMTLFGFIRIADLILIRILDWLIIAIAGLLLILLNYAVFSRFVLNASVSWGEELPAHILAALTFIGAAYLTRTNEHLGFDGFLVLLPDLVQRGVLVINLLLMTAFSVCLAYYGWLSVMSFGWARQLISLDIPVVLFRGVMPVAGIIMAVICIGRLIGLLAGRLTPNDFLPKSDG